MKLIPITFLLGLLIGPLAAQNIPIPPEIKQSLDTLYTGWKLSSVSAEFADAFFSSDTLAGSVVRGDFDDNGVKDFGLQITHTVNNRLARTTLVFLTRDATFTPLVVTSVAENADYYLGIREKGSEGYDFMNDKYFRFPIDAIEVCFMGKAGNSYILINGSFKEITTAD